MKVVRMMYVLAVVLASPALATETSGSEKGTATASTHACPAKADDAGKLRCSCAPMQDEQKRPDPIFTDAG